MYPKGNLQIPASHGTLEAILKEPKGDIRGAALVCHPHPLGQGTMHNKVVYRAAAGLNEAGLVALRFNFRGVGATTGVYDEGRGELQDLLAVIAHGVEGNAAQPLALAGFSFGSFVVSHAVESLGLQNPPQQLVLVGTAASRFTVAPIAPELHARTLVLHGEQDDTVPLSDVMDWARPQSLPVTVIPGVAHFFHGQLPLLRSLVVRHLLTQTAA